MILLTRSDQVGVTPFDSIQWAFEVHVKESDNGEFHNAVLFGNEDSPDRIEFHSGNRTRIWNP